MMLDMEDSGLNHENSTALINRKFRNYLIPTVITYVAIVTANVSSSIVVGNLISETALSAVGLSLPIVYTSEALFLLFAVGGAICVSIAKGQRKTETANRIFTMTFVSGIAVTFLFTAMLLLFMRHITGALAQGNAELAELAQAYLTPLSFLCPALMLVLGMSYFVRADGKPRIVALIFITSNFFVIFFTYLFIKSLGWGMTGAGLAFVLGYSAGILMLLPYFFSKQRTLRFVMPHPGDFACILRILSVGTPKSLMYVLLFLRALTLNALIVRYLGTHGMAAMTVCASALMIAFIFINGTNDSLMPIVGTLYGEKDSRSIRCTMLTGFNFMIVSCLAVSAIFIIVPTAIGHLFGIHSAQGIAIESAALRMFALSLPLYGINTLLQIFYQTTGRVKLASVTVFLNGFGFVVLFALLISRLNANFIWLAFVMSEAAALLVIIVSGFIIRKKDNAKGILLLHHDTE